MNSVQSRIPWSDRETTELLRKVAEGKTNKEISFQMQRSSKSIRTKLYQLGVACNLPPSHVNRAKLGPTFKPMPKRDPWSVKVKFEDITPDEARLITADAPKSAPFRNLNERYSIYGSSMAEMVA